MLNKTNKKGKGEGNIRQRTDGTWEGRFTAGKNDDGKQIQRSIYGKTRAEVSKKLIEILNELNTGDYIPPNKLTLSIWLELWFKQYASIILRPSTYISYEGYIYNHINPVMGGILLKDLTPERIQVFYNEKYQNGRTDNKGGLSPKTIRNLHNMLHKALDQACRNNLLAKNVTEHSVLPRGERREMRVLSRKEQKQLLPKIRTERMGFAILFDLSTGLRIGELCGLKWQDIDFSKKTFQVRRTLQRLKTSKAEQQESDTSKTKVVEGKVKTDKGYREIPIQEKIFVELLNYQSRQKQEKEEAAGAYIDNDYVFASAIGGAVEPSTMRDMFNRILKLALIEHANFHSLRHTFATRAIESGVSIKAVSDILGHATVQLTMDLYCHSSMDLKRDAVNMMADLW